MGVFDFLGASAGQAVAAPINAIGNVISKVYTTDGEKLSAQEVLERLRQAPFLGQIDIDKIDAASGQAFQKDWRPSMGWVCSISLFFYFVPQYILGSVLWGVMCFHSGTIVDFPISATPILELTGIMLGIYGTQHTIENLSSNNGK